MDHRMKALTAALSFELDPAKEVDIRFVQPDIKKVCDCGCKYFVYRPLTGIGIRRICRCCDRSVPYRN